MYTCRYDEWQNGLFLCYSYIIWLPCIDGHWKICDVARPINIISQSSIKTDYTVTYLTIFLIVYLSPDISSRCLFNLWQIPLGRNQGPGKLIMKTLDLPAIYRTEYARGYYVLCFILLILSALGNSCCVFTHILQYGFNGPALGLMCLWSKGR